MRQYKFSLFFKLGILLVLVLTFGCSLMSELTQDGIGQPISTVMDRLGPPTRVTSDGKGGNVYIWETWYSDGYNRYLRTNKYYTDSNGVIYKWS
jgi:hypothetical protein